MAQQWYARSYSQAVCVELMQSGATFTVHNTHERACNLVTARGDLVSLVAIALGNGPFHVTVPADLFAAVTAGDRLVNPRGSCLTWQGNSLELAKADAWLPEVQWSTIQLGEPISAYLFSAAKDISLVDLFQPAGSGSSLAQNQMLDRTQYGVTQLASGLSLGTLDSIYDGSFALAGLGSGLIPTGDDLLVGVMAALWLIASSCPTTALFRQHTIAAYCHWVSWAALGRTTLLSETWLRCATQNRFSQPWHTLANGLVAGDLASIAAAFSLLSSVGATSGPTALYGFVLTIRAVFDKHQWVSM